MLSLCCRLIRNKNGLACAIEQAIYFLMETEMNDKQAFELVAKICADFKGNLADHQAIQEALNIVRNKVFPAPIKEPETIKPDFGGDKKKK